MHARSPVRRSTGDADVATTWLEDNLARAEKHELYQHTEVPRVWSLIALGYSTQRQPVLPTTDQSLGRRMAGRWWRTVVIERSEVIEVIESDLARLESDTKAVEAMSQKEYDSI